MIKTIEVSPRLLAYSLTEYLKRHYTFIRLEDMRSENTYEVRKLIGDFLDSEENKDTFVNQL